MDRIYSLADELQAIFDQLATSRGKRRAQLVDRAERLSDQLDNELEILNATQETATALPPFGTWHVE